MPPPNPPTATGRQLPAARFALLLWLGVMLVVLAARAPYYLSPALEHGDAALNAIQIDQAKAFSEIHGNYSRFRFHHPGPAFFYVYAAAELVLCDWLPTGLSPINAHKLAGLALQSAFFALGLALLRDFLRSRLLVPLTLVAAAAHFGLVDYALWSIWPPHVLLMPFFAFGVACLSLANGRIDRLPWVLLAGSFLVHGHVAQPLFVGPLAVVAYAAAWRTHGAPWRAARAAHAVAGVVFLVAIAPFVLDALRGAESNFAEILRHLREAPGAPKKWAKVALYVASYFGYVRDQDVLLRELSWASTAMFKSHAAAFAAWAALLGASAWAWLRLRATPAARSFWNRFLAGLVLTALLAAYWARSQTGAMFEFNMYFFHAVTFGALLPLLAWLAEQGERWTRGRWAAAIALGAAVAAGALGFQRGPLNDYEAGLQRVAAVEAALADATAPSRPKFLSFGEETWDSAASVALVLQRQGQPFAVDGQWAFMLPRRPAPADAIAAAPLPYDVWRVLPAPAAAAGQPLGNEHILQTVTPELAPPATLTFTPEGSGRRYLVAGISHLEPHGAFSWLAGSDAVLEFAPGATSGDVEVQLAVVPWGRAGAPLEIHFNGAIVWRGPADRAQRIRVRLPAERWRARPVATLRLHLPGALNPYQAGRPLDWAGPGLSFRSIDFVSVAP